MFRSSAERAPEPSRCADEYKDGVAAYEHGDYRTAFVKFMEAANRGYIEAQYMVGRMYDDGRGVLQDYNQAVPWYRKAADQGNALAQSFLGSMYYEGRGVPQDYNQAVFWYRKAAEQGSALAQIFLGESYSAGEGVPQDYNQAALWFGKAGIRGMRRHRASLHGCIIEDRAFRRTTLKHTNGLILRRQMRVKRNHETRQQKTEIYSHS